MQGMVHGMLGCLAACAVLPHVLFRHMCSLAWCSALATSLSRAARAQMARQEAATTGTGGVGQRKRGFDGMSSELKRETPTPHPPTPTPTPTAKHRLTRRVCVEQVPQIRVQRGHQWPREGGDVAKDSVDDGKGTEEGVGVAAGAGVGGKGEGLVVRKVVVTTGDRGRRGVGSEVGVGVGQGQGKLSWVEGFVKKHAEGSVK